jgi:hypothetical protein
MKTINFLNKLIDNIEFIPDDADLLVEIKAEAEDLLIDEENRIEEKERQRKDAFSTKHDRQMRARIE